MLGALEVPESDLEEEPELELEEPESEPAEPEALAPSLAPPSLDFSDFSDLLDSLYSLASRERF